MRTVLHLVRPGAPPPIAPLMTERDWVVYLQPEVLAPSSHPAPFAPGPLTHDQLVSLSFAADLVITW